MAQHVVAESGEKVYLFDIAARLREDPAVKDALVCPLNTENSPLVAYIVLEDNVQDTQEEVFRRLDGVMRNYLPSGLRIEEFRLEHEQLKINIVGKIDRHYYSNEKGWH